MTRRRAGPVLLVLVAAVGVVALAHLVFASVGLPAGTVLGVLTGSHGADADPYGIDRFIVFDVRLPRLCIALFGGAALGLAGTVMQASFRNALASPEIVGTAAGAAFGGALAIVAGVAQSSVLAVPLASLCGAALVTWLVFVLAGSRGGFSATSLLLAGIALNTLVGALTSFAVMLHFDNYTASSEVLFWLMGGLEARTHGNVAITVAGCLLFGLPLLLRSRDLDLLTLRDDAAHSLGLDAARARRSLLWLACGLTATTVANTGGIAFVGLVVPHLARLLIGPSHRALLPAAAIAGAILLVLADLACRLAPPATNLRLSVVTSALGTPYFLYLLARHRRGEALR